MNVHDSQKVASLLLHASFERVETAAAADVLVINTCSIRDKAENQLYTELGRLREWKAERSGRVIGVGGCVAQQVGDALLKRFPHLDFVFGTHNVRWVPAMAEAARLGERSARIDETRSLERFDLPLPNGVARGTEGRAYVTVMEGCDMYCSFCIVPSTRGREISRPAEAIVAEAEALVAAGVCEITLLGQTVNAYGRHDLRRGRSDQAGTLAFAELLRQLDAIPGIRRIRYTSPHPLFFDEALIRAHGELERLCPHVHLPVQSGSDRVLELMRRRYTRARYLEIVAGLRASRPDLAITSDLIVGFPGETESDFQATLDLIQEAGFVDSFSFKYSPRPGTQAVELPGRVPPEVVARRLSELLELQRGLTLAYHRRRVGDSVEVLIEGDSRRGGGQLRGRDPYLRVVNLAGGDASDLTPGRLLRVEIVEATPHSLIGTPRAEVFGTADGTGENPARSLKLGGETADEAERSGALPMAGAAALRVIG